MKKLMFFLLWLAFSIPFTGFAQQNCNLKIEGIVQQPSCSGGMDGAVRTQIKGGTAPYSYVWSNGEVSKDASALTSGVHALTVRDSKGCVAKADFTLTDKKIDLGLQVEQKKAGNNKYVLQVVFQGNKKPYAITIKNLSEGLRAPNLPYKGEALPNGIYLLEAFTEAGCSVMQKVLIDAN